MIIFCCGMSRSGSTVQHQIVKCVLRASGKRWYVCEMSQSSIRYTNSVHPPGSKIVVKSETYAGWASSFLGKEQAIGISIYRDYRDVVASLMWFYSERAKYMEDVERTGAFEQVIKGSGRQALEWQSAWEIEPNVTSFRYEDLWPNLGEMTEHIADILKVKLSAEQIAEIQAETSVDENLAKMEESDGWIVKGSYPLTKSHISPRRGEPGRYVDALTPAQVTKVEKIAGTWLKNHGYKV